MPNTFAYIVLFSWPLVVVWLFRILPRSHAIVWSIMGGYLALPYGVGVNPPVLPNFDKTLIPALSATVMLLLGAGLPERPADSALAPRERSVVTEPELNGPGGGKQRLAFTRQTTRRDPGRAANSVSNIESAPGPIPRVVILLVVLLILTQFITMATNGDPYVVGVVQLPGLGLYDAFSDVQDTLIMVLPFGLGLLYLGAPERQAVLLRIFCIAGLIYTLPALFEIRMSPQLSRWTYGFLAQPFFQAMRDGGFRPVVFLQHGLWLAIFLVMAALAAYALWRHERAAGRSGGWALFAGLWLTGVLALCHSLGALAVLVVLAPFVLFLPARGQVLMAFCITATVLTYPMLRSASLVPVGAISDFAASAGANRLQSLEFRLENEDSLLALANQRPLAGWGGYGRGRVYNADSGKYESVTDGMWIIVMGSSGWLGYIAVFGLLGIAPVLLFLRRRRLVPDITTAGLCLVLAANLIDLIPNATLTPLTWLVAGALAGRCRFTLGKLPTMAAPRTLRLAPRRQARPGIQRFLAVAAMVLGLTIGYASAKEVPAASGLTNPTLAFGLDVIADWSTEMPFIDLMKTARPWIGHKGDIWSAMTYENLAAGGYLDAQGWPVAIPAGLTAVGTVWDWAGSAADPAVAASRTGVYILTYRGEGKLQIRGDVNVLQTKPGRILFQNLNGGVMTLGISETDPKHDGQYIRDIVIVPQKYADLQATGEIFNPDWLLLVADARLLRFKDWMQIDGTTQAAWHTRPQVSDVSWMMHGVPVEVMVQLANQIGIEPWFDMPAGADEDYICNFAIYVRDHLNPALKVHVEYSNETWNWLFAQTHWMLTQAQTVWGSTDKAAYIDYNAMVATKAALIWNQVFGPATKTRLDNVLGIQTDNTWGTERLLTAPLWKKIDPQGYVAPTTVFNSLAGTTYFGVQTIATPALREDLLARIKADPAAALAWLAERLQDPEYPASIPQIIKQWKADKALAVQYGLKLVAYEGGQHVLHSAGVQGLSKEDLAILSTTLSGFVRSPAMADLYRSLWAAWAQVSDGPFMQYVDVRQTGSFGSWGLYSALGDNNPRADLLRDLNAHFPAWFGDGGGPQYQQGVIRIAGDSGETLIGTDHDDFLIGGAGDDTIIPGKGHDAISGGDGMNTLVLSGAPSDYHLTAEGEIYRLTGPDIDDSVRGIGRFSFDGEGIRTLDEMLKT